MARDVALNPGLVYFPCRVCSRLVTHTQCRLQCDACQPWTYTKCAGVVVQQNRDLAVQEEFYWCWGMIEMLRLLVLLIVMLSTFHLMTVMISVLFLMYYVSHVLIWELFIMMSRVSHLIWWSWYSWWKWSFLRLTSSCKILYVIIRSIRILRLLETR